MGSPEPQRASDPVEGLDEQQRAAVCAPRGPVCVLAGAGTGKTRTITRRIARLVRIGQVAPGQVLAVTFTARAAGELRTRLRDLAVTGVQARTFHAAALRQLRYFWPQVVGDEPWPLLEHKVRLVGQAAQRAGVGTGADDLRDLAGEIEWAKGSLIPAADYPAAVAAAHRETPLPAAQVAAVYAGYEELKNRHRVLDFDDLLLHTAAALEEHPALAEEFRDRYRCFVVDEYQDVTPLQQRVLDVWLGARDDLTVVGDANQTIYSFAGAGPRFLLEFGRRFPTAVTVRLCRDYRSTPQVVSLANRVVAASRGRPAGARLTLEGQQPPGPEPTFTEYDDETGEAAAVAESVAGLLRSGVPAAEIAVLFRVNAQSEVYEQALDARGIPFQVRGGERFFRRPEVRTALRALRSAASATVSTAGAPGPSGAPGALGELVRALLARQGLTAEPPGGSAARSRWESLRAVAELADDLAAAAPGADLGRFVAELDARADAAHPPTVQGVTLASLHSSKGLEWDAVFLVGLVDGTLPIQYAEGRHAALEEERRLLYVGVTRARRWLALSWALSRSAGGRRSRRRSRFLHGLAPQQSPAGRAPAARATTAAAARCRLCGAALRDTLAVKLARCGSCPADADPRLLDRLVEWRSGRAREQRVPAYVVVTDATLTAIAEQRPADAAALTAIPGIGSAKLDSYGPEILALVRDSVTAGDGPAAATGESA